MDLKYEIKSFSPYEKWNYDCDGENVSYIVDKLIRLTAKLTEHFAGDIMYTITEYQKHVANGNDFDEVLAFREGGVNNYRPNSENVIERQDYIGRASQVWRLTYDPATQHSELKRVTLCARFGWNTDYVGGST